MKCAIALPAMLPSTQVSPRLSRTAQSLREK
jgi:hypothetical protein